MPNCIMFYSQGHTERQPFKPMGCWKNGQLPSLEGNASQLDGHYTQRTDAIYKCYKATRERGWDVFAVTDGGQCRSSANAADIYNEKGLQSSFCLNIQNGKGDSGNSHVYFATGE